MRNKKLRIIAVSVVLLIAIAAIAGGSKPQHETSKSDSPALVSSGDTGHAAKPNAKPQVFAGTGSENIGTVQVPTQSTLHWSCPSCAGGQFGGDNYVVSNSFNDNGTIDVNGIDQASGQTVIDAGTYHDVSIDTEGGSWTITITPGT